MVECIALTGRACPDLDETEPNSAGTRRSFVRLFRLALAIASLAAASPFTASAAGPRPDPPPVKSSPPPVKSSPPPATISQPTQSSPTTSSSTRKTPTTSKKRHAVTAAQKARARKSAAAHDVKTKTKPASIDKPRAIAKPIVPVATAAPGLSGRVADAFTVSLIGIGVLLLALGTLEPSLVGPPYLRKALLDHRGDLATAGILLLVTVGIAYLIVWGTAA